MINLIINTIKFLCLLKVYLIGRKKVGNKWRILLPVTNFFATIFFTDEYSYRYFFNKLEHLLFSNLKIP